MSLDFHAVGLEKIVVQNGSIRIYQNQRLCPSDVQSFMNKLERVRLQDHPEWRSHDYININGKWRHCTDATIELHAYVISHEAVVIRWRDHDPEKHQHYRGFDIRYIPVNDSHSHDQIFELHPQDSCSPFGWEFLYVEKKDLKVNAEGFFEVYLTGLEQLTTYDYAVMTYIYSVDDFSVQERFKLDPSMDGASSIAKRFRTEMNIPNRVKKIYPSEINTTSIKLKWIILEHETDGINFFYIDVEPLPLNIIQIDDRDYCEYPPELYEKSPEENSTLSFVERHFGNEYAASQDDCCRKCCPNLKPRNSSVRVSYTVVKDLARMTDRGEGIYTGMSNRVHLYRLKYTRVEREALIEGLSAFSQYRFYIHACASESKCSSYEVITLFTDIDTSLEKVDLRVDSYYTDGQVFNLKFDEPAGNGPIISYHVDIKQLANGMTINTCFTRRKHEKRNFK